jgi:hypothetical protein
VADGARGGGVPEKEEAQPKGSRRVSRSDGARKKMGHTELLGTSRTRMRSI